MEERQKNYGIPILPSESKLYHFPTDSRTALKEVAIGRIRKDLCYS